MANYMYNIVSRSLFYIMFFYISFDIWVTFGNDHD
jgi:hypothetical protein